VLNQRGKADAGASSFENKIRSRLKNATTSHDARIETDGRGELNLHREI
jgi:hypothetical protein